MEPEPDLELFHAVAERLKQAHARVRDISAPGDEQRRLARRLLAITDAAKHDLPAAARRLDHFLAELDTRMGPAGERDAEDGGVRGNSACGGCTGSGGGES